MATAATEEIEIVETPPTEETVEAPKPPAPVLADDDTDDHEEDGDPRGHEDPDITEEEREAIRVKRRQERKERKDRQEAARRRERAELDDLRRKVRDLEATQTAIAQRTVQSDLANIEGGIAAARREYDMAKEVVARAIAAANGADAAQAMEYRDQAAEKLRKLTALKESASQHREPPRQQPQGPDPTVVRLASAFADENKAWFDPRGGNEDSAIMLAIDSKVQADGYDPATPEYWSELRKRAARRLPERFAAPEVQREARGGPALGSGRANGGGTGATKFYLSPERKKALQDAGMWDDPEKRQKAVKAYAEFDKNNRK